MKILLTIILLSVCASLCAQSTDSISQAVHKKNIQYLLSKDTAVHDGATRIDFQLDFRNSFVRDFPVDIYGGNIGIKFRHRYRIGTGYYFFSQQFSNELLGLRPTTGQPYVDKNGVPIPISKLTSRQYVAASQDLSVNYACVNFTYRFFTSRVVDLYVPVEVGYGNFTEKLIDPSGNGFDQLTKAPTPTKGTFVPGQVGVLSIIKLHHWVYLLSAIGYRKTLEQTFETQNDYTNFESQFESYYYRLGLQVQIGTIWKKVHHKKTPKKD